MCDITIVSANNNSPEFARLLVESIRRFTTISYEIIVADSGSTFLNRYWLKEQDDVHLWEAKKEIDRSLAIRYAIENGHSKYVCFLDIDSFVMREGWAKDLVELYEKNETCKLITHDGKPIHKSLMFTDKEWLAEECIPTEKIEDEVITRGYTIKKLKTGNRKLKDKKNTYDLNEEPTFYHFGYGTRFNEHNPPRKEKICDYKLEEYFINKAKLFRTPLVCELLRITEKMAERTYQYKGYMICRDLMSLNKGLPWIERGAIEELDANLTKDSLVLEIGSGSSTSWLAERAKNVVSFESSPCWGVVVEDDLELKDIKNVELIIDKGYPNNGVQVSGDFDVILIDGPTKGRTLCIENTINHLKFGGLFVVDDAQRELYDEGLQQLDNIGWKRTDYSAKNDARVTSVWRAHNG